MNFYVLFYVEAVDTLCTKYTRFNGTHVEAVDTGFDTVVFAAFTQMHTDTHSVLYTCSSPLQEGRLLVQGAPRLVGLAVHHQAVRGCSFVLKHSGTCQNYKGNCRQDAQPIPNS